MPTYDRDRDRDSDRNTRYNNRDYHSPRRSYYRSPGYYNAGYEERDCRGNFDDGYTHQPRETTQREYHSDYTYKSHQPRAPQRTRPRDYNSPASYDNQPRHTSGDNGSRSNNNRGRNNSNRSRSDNNRGHSNNYRSRSDNNRSRNNTYRNPRSNTNDQPRNTITPNIDIQEIVAAVIQQLGNTTYQAPQQQPATPNNEQRPARQQTTASRNTHQLSRPGNPPQRRAVHFSPHNRQHSYQPNSGTKTPASATFISENSDFKEMRRSLFRTIQLQYHLDNWTKLPASIRKSLFGIADDITPPDATDQLKTDLLEILTRTGEEIQHLVREHMESRLHINRNTLKKLNPTDKNHAIEITYTLLNKRIGQRIDGLHDKIEYEAQRIGCDHNQTITFADAVRNTATTKTKPKEINTAPIPTSNRFQPLADNEDMETENTEPPRPSTPQAVRKTPPPPIRKTPPQPQHSDSATAPSTSTALPPRAQPRVHIGNKEWPKTTLLPDTEFLMIGDSNLSNTKEKDIPPKWQVLALPGARYSHVIDAIHCIPPGTRLKLIIAAGINHRTQSLEQTYDEIYELKALIDERNWEAYVMGISISRLLEQDEQNILDEVNSYLQDAFRPKYMFPLRSCEVKTRDKGVHYTEDTKHKIWARITNMISNQSKN